MVCRRRRPSSSDRSYQSQCFAVVGRRHRTARGRATRERPSKTNETSPPPGWNVRRAYECPRESRCEMMLSPDDDRLVTYVRETGRRCAYNSTRARRWREKRLVRLVRTDIRNDRFFFFFYFYTKLPASWSVSRGTVVKNAVYTMSRRIRSRRRGQRPRSDATRASRRRTWRLRAIGRRATLTSAYCPARQCRRNECTRRRRRRHASIIDDDFRFFFSPRQMVDVS